MRNEEWDKGVADGQGGALLFVKIKIRGRCCHTDPLFCNISIYLYFLYMNWIIYPIHRWRPGGKGLLL